MFCPGPLDPDTAERRHMDSFGQPNFPYPSLARGIDQLFGFAELYVKTGCAAVTGTRAGYAPDVHFIVNIGPNYDCAKGRPFQQDSSATAPSLGSGGNCPD